MEAKVVRVSPQSFKKFCNEKKKNLKGLIEAKIAYFGLFWHGTTLSPKSFAISSFRLVQWVCESPMTMDWWAKTHKTPPGPQFGGPRGSFLQNFEIFWQILAILYAFQWMFWLCRWVQRVCESPMAMDWCAKTHKTPSGPQFGGPQGSFLVQIYSILCSVL